MDLAQIGVSVRVDGAPAPGVPAPGGSLPVTGLDIAILLAVAVVLIGAGWLAIRLGARRRMGVER